MSICEFYNMLRVRAQLIMVKEKDLEKIMTEEEFSNFLEGVFLLLEKEEAFLLISRAFIEKIRNVIEVKRFSKNVDSNKINQIIAKINQLETLEERVKVLKVDSYIQYQSEIRQIDFGSLENFLGAISLDSEVLDSLLKYDSDYRNDEIFLSATSYFLNVNPDIYKDEDISFITKKKLDEIILKKVPLRSRYIKKYAKRVRSNFSN